MNRLSFATLGTLFRTMLETPGLQQAAAGLPFVDHFHGFIQLFEERVPGSRACWCKCLLSATPGQNGKAGGLFFLRIGRPALKNACEKPRHSGDE